MVTKGSVRSKTLKRKIGVVTGARAEYGYLRPLMRKIEESDKLELLLCVTGLHLAKEYGYTVQEIVENGFKITRTIDMDVKAESSDHDLAISIGKGISGFADVLGEDRPEILVIFGDRVEPLSATVAAVCLNIPVAHINGGDVGLGDIDDSTRHAITKFAHLHFTASKQSKERVLRLGEESWRVFQVGALSLDTILNEKPLPEEELRRKYGLSGKSIILICYHPTTTEWLEAREQMRLVMEAVSDVVREKGMEAVIIYPNAYPGGYQIVNVINEYGGSHDNVHVFKNIPHLDYISLMSVSSVFVGNSSSGIIEAPSLGLPYVCIGTRQQGRERAKNVVDVGYSKEEIVAGVKKALSDKQFLDLVRKRESPYGDGKASERIVEVLTKTDIDIRLLQKKIAY